MRVFINSWLVHSAQCWFRSSFSLSLSVLALKDVSLSSTNGLSGVGISTLADWHIDTFSRSRSPFSLSAHTLKEVSLSSTNGLSGVGISTLADWHISTFSRLAQEWNWLALRSPFPLWKMFRLAQRTVYRVWELAHWHILSLSSRMELTRSPFSLSLWKRFRLAQRTVYRLWELAHWQISTLAHSLA
jgi:hypothetical protein